MIIKQTLEQIQSILTLPIIIIFNGYQRVLKPSLQRLILETILREQITIIPINQECMRWNNFSSIMETYTVAMQHWHFQQEYMKVRTVAQILLSIVITS